LGRFSRLIHVVDSHCAGEPLRVVTGPPLSIPGDTMLAKRSYAMARLDGLRRFLLWEPRGHADMYGCLLTDPVSPGARLGTLWMHTGGFSLGCGHGTIALATVLLETGMVAWPEDCVCHIGLDVPSGCLNVTVHTEGDRVKEVTFRNVPSFVVETGVGVEVLGQRVEVDVAYGGAFYAIVEAAALGLNLGLGEIDTLVFVGREIMAQVDRKVSPTHPTEPGISGTYGVIFTGPPTSGRAHSRNITVFGSGSVDRSPCGTGTSARLALMFEKGQISLGEEFVHESVIGTLFRGTIVEETSVAGRRAVVPAISGTAHITGFSTFVLDSDDTLAEGFMLR
jgi:proline racemase